MHACQVLYNIYHQLAQGYIQEGAPGEPRPHFHVHSPSASVCGELYQQTAERQSTVIDIWVLLSVDQLHSVLAQLEPVAQRHGLLGAANVSSLITQHQQIQQQIVETKQRATRLQLIADIEHRREQYESWLSEGTLRQASTLCHPPFATHPLPSGFVLRQHHASNTDNSAGNKISSTHAYCNPC